MRRTMMASVLALFASQAHAGGSEDTWGPVPMHRAYKGTLPRDSSTHMLARPTETVPDPITITPVKVLIPTVAIAVDKHGDPVCDYDRQMFAGRNDLYWRYCGIRAESTAEPSTRNTVSPQ